MTSCRGGVLPGHRREECPRTYLLPGDGGEKAYTLMREALRESGRMGIAKFVMRNKPHLAAVETIKDALVLSTLRFREELVPVSEYEKASFRKSELTLAHQLVETLAASWEPARYTDEYRANLQEIIDAKRKRQEPDLQRQEPRSDRKVVDLMERLRRSLGDAPKPAATKKAASKKTASRSRGATRGARSKGRTRAA